jgi:lambda family phage portal protein
MFPFNSRSVPVKGQRTFAGAQYGRLVADWITSGATLDSEIFASLPQLRNRSRQLARDNVHMTNFLGLVQDNVVGDTGISFQAQARMQRGKAGDDPALDDKTNDSIEELWEDWTRKESCHVAGLLAFSDIERLIIRACAEDGEFLVRKIYQKMGDSPVPMALELIEPERLVETYNARSDGTANEIRMGVELNGWQRPVAYYFHPKTPNDLGYQDISVRAGKYIRIPANEIIHGYIFSKVRQTRGIPWVHAAIMKLHHLHGYEEAEIVGARAASALMGFIESPEDESGLGDGEQDGDTVTEFEPGVFKKLNPGEKVSIPNQAKPSGQFDPFTRIMLRSLSAGLRISYESLSRDYSQTNYSSARQGMLTDRDRWKALQGWMVRNFHQSVYESWLDMAVLSGSLKLKNYELNPRMYRKVKWLPRGWGWVDPQKEITAYKDAVRSGFKTQADVIAEGGGDFDEFLEQRQAEVQAAEDAGLVFDTNPAQVNEKGITQPGIAPDTAEDGDGNPGPGNVGQEAGNKPGA